MSPGSERDDEDKASADASTPSGSGAGPSDSSERARTLAAELTRPFRPRAARVVSLALAGLVAAGTLVLLVTIPQFAPTGTMADAVGFALLGVLIVWFCWREASVVAVPDETGLRVRNLMLSRRVEWAEIVSVRFGSGRPWVQLDLADGTTHAVMGVQRADGAYAEAEARRLATIVVLRTRTPQDD